MCPFTLHDGVLALEEGSGLLDGPRAIDPKAGLVRYADSSLDFPLSRVRAVASVYVERELQTRVGNSAFELRPQLVHAVVLVKDRAPPDVAALLQAMATGAPTPPGFSIRGAAAAVDAASIPFCLAGSPSDSRYTAKAIARLAALPMLELYGEFYVFRHAAALDLSLRERLARAAPPDLGPPPPGLVAQEGPTGPRLRFVPTPPPIGPFVALATVAFAIGVGLLLVEPAPGLAAIGAAALMLVLAVRARRVVGAELEVGQDQIVWRRGARVDAIEVSTLEMMRVGNATLVFVGQTDEMRCDLPSEEHATWARRAIERALAPKASAYR